MAVLLVVMMLTAGAAGVQDMSGRMFTFPQQTNTACVKLNTAQHELRAVTLCQRSFTDLRRVHSLFSLATSYKSNEILLIWDHPNDKMVIFIRDKMTPFQGFDYKPNMWHSICTTWEAQSGLVQMWFDGMPLIRKYSKSVTFITGPMKIFLGQDQDSFGGAFDFNQSYVGMMTDVHMWNYMLSSCEIQNYMDERSFTPGNVINWKALDYQIVDRVLTENRFSMCTLA